MVMRLVQVGGVITLLLLGGSVWLTARRDRRRARSHASDKANGATDPARTRNPRNL
jgi:hypothetical protein